MKRKDFRLFKLNRMDGVQKTDKSFECRGMNYIAVRGTGDSNQEDGEYKQSIGSYDDEPDTVAMMHEFMEQQGYELDITDKRLHHEIYLSDAR